MKSLNDTSQNLQKIKKSILIRPKTSEPTKRY